MKQAVGITIEHDAQGVASFAHIDLKKYGKRLIPFFEEIGVTVEETTYDPKFVEMIKEQEKLPGVKMKSSDVWK